MARIFRTVPCRWGWTVQIVLGLWVLLALVHPLWGQPAVAVARDHAAGQCCLYTGNVFGFDAHGEMGLQNGWGPGSRLFEIHPELGFGKWLQPNPNPQLNISLEENLSGVAYASGSLYFGQSTMGIENVVRVDPGSGLATGVTPPAIIRSVYDTGRNSLRLGNALNVFQFKVQPDGVLYGLAYGYQYLEWDSVRDWDDPILWQILPEVNGDCHVIARFDGSYRSRYPVWDPDPSGWSILADDVQVGNWTGHDLEFLPGNRLAVSFRTGAVNTYDLGTGALLGSLVLPGLGGPDAPTGLAYDHQGTLYVANSGNRQILRYDATTGAFQGNMDLLGFQWLNDILDLEFLDGAGGNTLLLSQANFPHLVKISNLHGPGPAIAEPFGPPEQGPFKPQEAVLYMAIIPETSSDPLLAAGMAAAAAAANWNRRRHPGAGSAGNR